MIRRLRKRFIRIAMISVALVMALLTVIVNTANFVSTNRDLNTMLHMIAGNAGTFPEPLSRADDSAAPPEKPDGEDDSAPPAGDPGADPGASDTAPQDVPKKPDDSGPYGPETPYSTRYFVLRYDADGSLTESDLSHIAAVTEDDLAPYLAAAVRRESGFSFYSGYKLFVAAQGDGTYMAIFLDCSQALRAVRLVALCSLAADAVCIALVYVLVVLLSRRAIDPVVRSAAQQKQFITDASHELKTPLTVITTCLTLLKMDPSETKWIDKAEAQTKKMSELVASLVTLSRMDEEEPPMTNTTFDLSEAVTDTAESFRDSAEAGGHALTLSVAPGIEYHGDEGALRQLTSILLDNALRYSLPGGDIALSLTREKRSIVLRQSNPCAPLTSDELSRLFDRFYRPDASRTAATGGFGVGLSIARGIAQAHGGTIRATCPEPGRIEFTLTLKA